jgi:hypothetical protein
MKKALLTIVAFGFGVASAASNYSVDLYRATNVNGTEFKPGVCKVEVQGDKVIFKQGKTTAETQARVETRTQKFESTTVGYNGETANGQIQEIRLGGTKTMLVFDQAGKTTAAGAEGQR